MSKKELKQYAIIGSSPVALEQVSKHLIGTGQLEQSKGIRSPKYPFCKLLIGESFTVPYDDLQPGTMSSLRSSVCFQSKRLSCTFKIFIHDEYKCVEIARLK